VRVFEGMFECIYVHGLFVATCMPACQFVNTCNRVMYLYLYKLRVTVGMWMQSNASYIHACKYDTYIHAQ